MLGWPVVDDVIDLISFLFRVLGLSVILAEKLLRARKARRLDPVRDLKARQLIHHILWLAREGLVMVEQYILPMVGNYVDLKVLSYKLRASFYHIFVLFHNEPAVNNRIARSRSGSAGSGAQYSLYPDPLAPKVGTGKSTKDATKAQTGRQRSPAISLGGVIGGSTTAKTPPGLPLPNQFSTSTYSAGATQQVSGHGVNATYLLPLVDYTPHATAAFKAADALAESLLPGSHPLRLSVKVEYVAYVYDCLKEYEVSRRMARIAIKQVYTAKEGMDDESFEDAKEMVGMLGRMMRRGLGAGTSQSQSGGLASDKGNGSISGRVDDRRQQPSTWV